MNLCLEYNNFLYLDESYNKVSIQIQSRPCNNILTVNFMSRMVLACALAGADGLHWLTLKKDFHWVVI